MVNPVDETQKEVTKIARRFLSLYIMCTTSKDFYKYYKENPRPFLTSGYYDNGFVFPGCEMKIPQNAKIYLSPLPSWPWIAVFNKGTNLKLPSKAEGFEEYGDLLEIFPIEVSEAIIEIGFGVLFPRSCLHRAQSVEDMGDLVFASLENLRSTITVEKSSENNSNSGMVHLKQIGEFNSFEFNVLPDKSKEYEILILIPDWSDFFDDYLTLPFVKIGGEDQITLTTC